MSVQQDGIRAPTRRARAVACPAGEPDGGCRFTVTVLPSAEGNIVVLRVTGEIDLCTAGLLEIAVRNVVSQRPEHLIVDLAGVRFCGARGLAVLVDAAADHGVRYALSGASPQAERIWTSLWPADLLPIRYPTARVGILAAMAGQAARRVCSADRRRRQGGPPS